MTQEERFINGELLRLRREERGWVISDMALRSCMSVKQIRQLEEGGTSAFYSEAVKLTAARKAATILGLSEHEVLERPPEAKTPMVDQHVLAELESLSTATADPVEAVDKDQTAETAPEVSAHVYPKAAATSPVHVASAVPPASDAAEAKPKTSLWTIVSLFFVALAVAAYLQPQEEEAVEVAPPLQAVPEAETAASGAESAASAASAAVADTPASAAVKPATMPAATASSASSAAVSAIASVRTTASATAAPVPAAPASRAP